MGSAFLVSERHVLTALANIDLLASGRGTRPGMRAGARAIVDFSDAVGVSPGKAVSNVLGVQFGHPFFSVTLLELAEPHQ